MGRCKALLDYGGQTAIARLAAGAREGGKAGRIVVVAAEPHLDAVKEEARRFGLGVQINRHPENGRTGSVKLGLTAVRECDAAFIAPVDFPLATDGDFFALRNSLQDSLARFEDPIGAVPVSGGRGGHPILFSRNGATRAMALADDAPLRDALNMPGGLVLRVPTSDSVLRNVDTPEDYQKTLESLAVKGSV